MSSVSEWQKVEQPNEAAIPFIIVDLLCASLAPSAAFHSSCAPRFSLSSYATRVISDYRSSFTAELLSRRPATAVAVVLDAANSQSQRQLSSVAAFGATSATPLFEASRNLAQTQF